MLESLRKKLSFNNQGSALEQASGESMKTFETTQQMAAQLQEAVETIQQLNAVVEEKEKGISALSSQLEVLLASNKEAKEQLEAFQAAQAATVEKSRKDALAAVMGADNPELEAEFAILKGLDESVFSLVLKSKAAAAEALSKSAMFKEVGVPGEADVDAPKESAEMRVLKQKYQPAK